MNSQINLILPYFSFNYLNSYTHDFIYVPDRVDDGLKSMIEKLENSKYLDNTLLIIFSDHGNRLSSYSIFTPLSSAIENLKRTTNFFLLLWISLMNYPKKNP